MVSDFLAVEYGERFRSCRLAMGLTQLELSVKLKLTRSSIANIEAGRQLSMIDAIAGYADMFQVDPCWLAFGRVSVEGRPLPRPRTVATTDLVTLSDDLQTLAMRAMKLSKIADPSRVEEVALGDED